VKRQASLHNFEALVLIISGFHTFPSFLIIRCERILLSQRESFMPIFVPGLELNRRFYEQVVRPLLDVSFPDLPYAAALLGPGSETLGFDTEMSMDHDWGLRLFIFLREEDADQGDAIANLLSHQLPHTFSGFPVSFPVIPIEPRTCIMQRDPDHDPAGAKVERRAIQLGLRGEVLVQYAREWIIEIQDITDFVYEQRQYVQTHAYQQLVTPREMVYPVTDAVVATRLGVVVS
jgi:hypothetical protein